MRPRVTIAAKQDIAAVAEAHTVSYIAVLLSLTFTTSISRATKMASYYLSTITSFASGSITQISDLSLLSTLIVGTLDKLKTDEGMYFEEKEHRIEVVGAGSAVVWITFRRKGIVWTNVYFFRRMESGEVGWEGGFFDGEMGMLKEFAKED